MKTNITVAFVYACVKALQKANIGVDAPMQNFSSGIVVRIAFGVATIVDPEILSVGDIAFQAKSEQKMLSMIGGKEVCGEYRKYMGVN